MLLPYSILYGKTIFWPQAKNAYYKDECPSNNNFLQRKLQNNFLWAAKENHLKCYNRPATAAAQTDNAYKNRVISNTICVSIIVNAAI